MDSISHTLLGLTLYGTINKTDMSKKLKKSLVFTTIAGSHIPDIDIVYQLTEKGRIMYQMWHRGLSHSLLLAPIWALLIYGVSSLIFKVKHKIILYYALLSVFLHIGFDALNTWGTGLFEPFINTRVSVGVISIVDFVIWLIILIGFIFTKIKLTHPKFKIWRMVCIGIFLHVSIQFMQGMIILNQTNESYEKTVISAGFIPGQYKVISKYGDTFEIYNKTIWSKKDNVQIIKSKEDADLTPLFEQNPRAKVVKEWSPFVVIVEEEGKLGIYDPRFYRNDGYFVGEYIKINK